MLVPIDGRALARTLAASSLLALAACTTPATHPKLDKARAAVDAARGDPDVAAYASVRLDEAEEALATALAAFEDGADHDEVDHLAYLTGRRAAIARERAAERRAQKAIEALSEERQQIQLQARSLEIEQLQEQLAELQAKETDRGIVLTLDDILFDFDSADLRAGGMQQVARIADFLRQHPERDLLVEGHTDDTGPDSYNLQLSEQRARSVRAALVSYGIDPRRVVAQGYGEQYPVTSNVSPEGRQENRRVEIVILHEGRIATTPAAGRERPVRTTPARYPAGQRAR